MLLSSTGNASISPSRNSTLASPVRAANLSALCCASLIISGVMSTPITSPVLPVASAAAKTSLPAPLPRSSTVSPALISENASGLPQDSPSSASGTGGPCTATLLPAQQSGPQQLACFCATLP